MVTEFPLAGFVEVCASMPSPVAQTTRILKELDRLTRAAAAAAAGRKYESLSFDGCVSMQLYTLEDEPQGI